MKKVRKRPDNSNELSIINEIVGIVFLFIAIFFTFSLISFTPDDPSFFHDSGDKTIKNFGGRIGAYVSAILFNLFGYSSYIIVFFLLFCASFFLFNRRIKNMISKSFGYLLLLFSFSAFVSNFNTASETRSVEFNRAGGVIGEFINSFFKGEIKTFFSVLLFSVLILISFILIAKLSLRKILKFVVRVSMRLFNIVMSFIKEQISKYRKSKRVKRIREKYRTEIAPDPKEKKEEIQFKEKKKIVKEPSKIPEEAFLFSDFEKQKTRKNEYRPPPLSYLDAPTEKSKIDYSELEEKREELAQRLEEFRIRGKILEYTPGPVITTYEFVPDIGVKVKEVTNLSEDLALVAKAQYVRIERILGKKAIGIEIPNKKREIIHLREIIESDEYKQSSSPLVIALGKTKSGEIFTTDLREMPHLLVAGATGSGKSVAIHTIILSILFKSSPDEVKFVLIDPKRVELAIYNSLPHLLTPVVVNTKFAKNSLDWAVSEMETRYKKLAMFQVRNIEQYNKKLELLLQSDDEEISKIEDVEKLPYIVIIIDEFADLMLECQREIEDDIAKIAQKARAVGIHLILATQRPSIDVITGTIKNNFPSRIALAVPSKHDSRTIIDVMGAEKLLGHGDMLFLPPKTASLVRLHCAYVSEEEALRVVNHLSKLEKPRYNTQVIKPKSRIDSDIPERDLDSLFFDAAEIVLNTGQASASYLQRKMSIGYARAGRLIDQLEAKGVVSAPNSKNQREILMKMEDLEALRSEE